MKLFVAALMVLVLSACQTTAPKEVPTGPGTETTQPEPTTPPKTETPVNKAAAVLEIQKIMESDACSKYNWKDRGQPVSKSYYTGVGVSFARALCNPDREDVKAISAARKLPESVWDWGDALSHYNSNYQALGLNNDSNGEETLLNLYTLIIGSGMRESNGKYCASRDASADNTAGETAEAGTFQSSYNVRTYYATEADYKAKKLTVGDSVIVGLYNKYKKDQSQCDLEVWSKGVTCTAKNLTNYGTGEGVNFQKLTKECPAMATEIHARALRVNRRHYGPINTKSAELRPECRANLDKVRKLVKANPDICKSL